MTGDAKSSEKQKLGLNWLLLSCLQSLVRIIVTLGPAPLIYTVIISSNKNIITKIRILII